MKYPKLWDGPSPVGEAMVRALQQTDAPFLTTIAPDGTIAKKMGALSEVSGKVAIDFLTYQGVLQDSSHKVRIWGAQSGHKRYLRRGTLIDDQPDRYPVAPVREMARGAGRCFGLSGSTTIVSSIVQFDVHSIGPTGGAKQLFSFDVFDGQLPHFVVPAKIDGQRTQGIHYLHRVAGHGSAVESRFKRIFMGEDGVETQDHTVYEFSWPYGRFYGGRIARTRPNALRHYAADVLIPDLGEPSQFTVSVRDGDGLGQAWQSSGDSGFEGLFASNGASATERPVWGFAYVARDTRQTMQILPTDDGEVLMFVRSMRAINTLYGGAYFVACDPANADTYADDAAFATAGITILKGVPGSLQVIARLKIAGRALDIHSAAVSGSTIVALVTESRFDRYTYTDITAQSFNNADFETAEPLLLFSEDNGVSWAVIALPTVRRHVGQLSVAGDGRFLLPVMLTGNEDWGVFAFPSPGSDDWEIVGRFGVEGEHAIAGCVFNVARGGRWHSATPGQRWLSDDKIQPPWEGS